MKVYPDFVKSFQPLTKRLCNCFQRLCNSYAQWATLFFFVFRVFSLRVFAVVGILDFIIVGFAVNTKLVIRFAKTVSENVLMS